MLLLCHPYSHSHSSSLDYHHRHHIISYVTSSIIYHSILYTYNFNKLLCMNNIICHILHIYIHNSFMLESHARAACYIIQGSLLWPHRRDYLMMLEGVGLNLKMNRDYGHVIKYLFDDTIAHELCSFLSYEPIISDSNSD